MLRLLCILLTCISLNIISASSQSLGPRSPLGAYEQFSGCLSCPGSNWSNTPGVRQADSSFCEVNLYSWPDSFQSNCFYSRYLFVTDFGFGIPSGAVIKGVKAEVLRVKDIGIGLITDSAVQLYCTNGPVGTIKADTTPVQTTPAYAVYGDSTDSWGYFLSPDSTNRPDFGVCIRLKNTQIFSIAYTVAYIDHVRMTIWYDTGSGIKQETRTSNTFLSYSTISRQLTLANNSSSTVRQLLIFDQSGKVVMNRYLSTQPGQAEHISVSLPSGIYLWTTDQGLKGKIVIE